MCNIILREMLPFRGDEMFVVYLVSFDNKEKPHYYRLKEFTNLDDADSYLKAKISEREKSPKKITEHWISKKLIHVDNYSYTIMIEN